ncbi:MAG: exodeoxyribonuclease VII large subunit [Algoriphagus sp.]|jgi:exodeoxyribonuclease VII large subunit|uniref:exodeoxyribonuclease VII large subunit n=1 Tax=Algoriphagus sp. TaxID=1872435 RepID=UPI00274321E0|nr:exodeoxyribonuclease VII large subunit [Algoriphagus sp.]MDP4748587.1 exodeoxyribonuclease VII large subunit [Algoriphagus sp.]MDP4839493.1 exodeoxyribonuclease VII large subunit [Algoriphagus sp.]MDP5125861.1 exodeoxyribonuclease VII large subunit [Algoriphagus sp.]
MIPLSVVQLTSTIQQVLEKELEPLIWVVGELADFRQAPQGHVYFELVEKEGNQVQAKIRANLWQFTFRTVAAKFESVTGTTLKSGMKVLAQVSVTYHPVYGLSLNVKDIDPSFSLGERARIRQETVNRLTQEGKLRSNAQVQLPLVIQRIAVISSSTAAGYGDFINQINGNPSGYKIYHRLFPSLMQGNEAVPQLLAAMDHVAKQAAKLHLDALVIIRGGGAQLDLDCFDDYTLGLKIAEFPLPVFTGIGHERDETIADLVAHTRLKTPTAVAEFILSSYREFEDQLGIAAQRLDWITRSKFKEEERLLQSLGFRLQGEAKQLLSRGEERVRTCSSRIFLAAKSLGKQEIVTLSQKSELLKKESQRYLKQQMDRVSQLELQSRQLNPASLLKKGYTRTEKEGIPIHKILVTPGDQLITFTATQKISSTVQTMDKK